MHDGRTDVGANRRAGSLVTRADGVAREGRALAHMVGRVALPRDRRCASIEGEQAEKKARLRINGGANNKRRLQTGKAWSRGERNPYPSRARQRVSDMERRYA